jgi:hypothetical protein
MLRVIGSAAKVRAFIARTHLQPYKVYFRGEPRVPRSRGPSKHSGFNVPVTSSAYGGSLMKQSRVAAAFIRRHRAEFVRLKKAAFSVMVLDFGLYDLASDKHPWPTYQISRQLIALAGEFGFDIELSFYGPE